jgi:cytochrome c oxidase assembly protein subunit 15
MKKYFTFQLKQVLVYLVIIAGALVRMTGSEWAVLTGQNVLVLYSPQISRTHMDPNREFEEGQVIIKDDKLWVANGDFTTQTYFNKQQWRLYTETRLCVIHATETWIEYINRLVELWLGLLFF